MNRSTPNRNPNGKRSAPGRAAIPAVFAAMCVLALAGPAAAKKMVILGIDGMDPRLLEKYTGEGIMPNFSALIEQGDFKPLQTTVAPQSPIAWSTFITGMDPGGHGIFDFVHRDPKTMLPFLSMSKAESAGFSLPIGSWVLPLSSGKVELLRKGKAFWELLGENGVPTTIFRMPVNFPPVPAPLNRSISGMGTPDITGTPGTFSYFASRLPENADEFSGGKAYKVEVKNNTVRAELRGPENPFYREKKETASKEAQYEHPPIAEEFTVHLDRAAGAAKFEVSGNEFILKEGEWSDWVPVGFDAVPLLVEIGATARFYLKEIEPEFKLYVTPLQINPESPAMPISHPASYSKHLCDCIGFFYTQELPEDTKAFTHGVFGGMDFWQQLMFVYEEGYRALEHMLEEHGDGLLFFYFGTVDQGCHMLWHYMDEHHPGHEDHEFLRNGIREIYKNMDETLGHVMKSIDAETTLVVMSDHGFAPFYWGVNLNTWLYENGYLALRDPARQGRMKYFGNVDWSKTKAYALGLNGLYVNLKGREKWGAVNSGYEYDQLLERLETDLLAMTDPRNGKKPVSAVVMPRKAFHGPERENGPDIVVGYDWGYRSSWESPLGEFPKEVFVDNLKPWSGDHCIDNRVVPGILVTNQKINHPNPSLFDLTVGVLDEFGVEPLDVMIGKDCLAPPLNEVSMGSDSTN